MKRPGELEMSKITQMFFEQWNPLSEQHRQMLMDHIKVEVFKREEAIQRTGERPEFMAFLMQGKVKIIKEGVGEHYQIVRIVKPGESFGYRAYFTNDLYKASAVALETTFIVFVPITVVVKLMYEDSNIGMLMIRQLAAALGTADNRIVCLTQKHIRGRLADTLLMLYDRYGVEADGCTLGIYLSRKDLASLSNMTTSNCIRTLSEFAKSDYVVVNGRRIRLLDIAELRRIAAEE